MDPYENLDRNTKYALVENGVVVEYPVPGYVICERGHPFEWYKKLSYEAKPEHSRYDSFNETAKLVGDEVIVTTEVTPVTLQGILDYIATKQVADGETFRNVTIADLEPDLIAKTASLIKAYVQNKLDTFADTHGYDNIFTAVSYKDDPSPIFAADALRAIKLRSETWTEFNSYQFKILNAMVEIPKTVEEIDAVLPKLSWYDEVVVTETPAVEPEAPVDPVEQPAGE